MLRNLTFVVQFAFFSIRPKVFAFLSNFWATFVNAKRNFWLLFLATFEHLFEKLRDTFWKISNNLWKALRHDTKGLVSASFTGLPKAKWGFGNTRARGTSKKHERGMMGTSILFLPFPSLPSSGAGPPPRSQGSLLLALNSPYGAREGRVGENPENEVAGPSDIPASLDNNRST